MTDSLSLGKPVALNPANLDNTKSSNNMSENFGDSYISNGRSWEEYSLTQTPEATKILKDTQPGNSVTFRLTSLPGSYHGVNGLAVNALDINRQTVKFESLNNSFGSDSQIGDHGGDSVESWGGGGVN